MEFLSKENFMEIKNNNHREDNDQTQPSHAPSEDAMPASKQKIK